MNSKKIKVAIYPLLIGLAQLVVTGCVLATPLHAQQTINDARLKQLNDSLPKGWEMEAALTPFNADSDPELFLFITRKEEVKALPVNKINIDVVSGENLYQRAEKEGKPTQLELKMRLEPKWDMGKLKAVWAYNDSLQRLIDNAYGKYNIGDLERALGKGDFSYDDSTPEKRKRLKDYNDEREKLHKQKKPWPGYTSSNYSVFFYYDYGKWQYQQVVPPKAEAEEFKVVKLVESILKPDYTY